MIQMSGLRIWLIAVLAGFAALVCFPSVASAEKETSQVDEAKAAVSEAGTKSVEAAEGFVQKVNENALSNRSRDEIIAWLLIGVMVGSVAGMMSTFKSTGLGKAGRLVLGLAGAFVGGMIVRVGELDHGWGEVVIRYEEALYSLVAAVVFVVAGRLIRSRMNRKKAS